jgi:glyoxylase-like metal-dependent hydrolase (beta-lactamase superfamily II)
LQTEFLEFGWMMANSTKSERYSPLVRRVLAPNPSPWTLDGTNTWLVGLRSPIVIDPGPEIDSHFEAILEAAGEVRAILLTHSHRDHAEGAARFAAITRAPLAIMQPALNASLCSDAEPLIDGQIITADSASLRVVATPGHASDHSAFLLTEEHALFTGDHVLGKGTTVVAHPDGNMRAYMHSLDQLIDLRPKRIYPGHGPVIDDPAPVLNFYKKHRLERETAVLETLSETPQDLETILNQVYTDVAPAVLPAARLSLAAHLEKLVSDRKASEENGTWRI